MELHILKSSTEGIKYLQSKAVDVFKDFILDARMQLFSHGQFGVAPTVLIVQKLNLM
jgi:hypothetical protein